MNSRFGPYYWMVDMDMDCSATENGWFEFVGAFRSSTGCKNLHFYFPKKNACYRIINRKFLQFRFSYFHRRAYARSRFLHRKRNYRNPSIRLRPPHGALRLHERVLIRNWGLPDIPPEQLNRHFFFALPTELNLKNINEWTN